MTEKSIDRRRLLQLSPPTCRKCPQPRFLVPDKSALPERHYGNDGLTSTISHRTLPHESGLCYYHLKEKLGIFNWKYPLKFPAVNEGV